MAEDQEPDLGTWSEAADSAKIWVDVAIRVIVVVVIFLVLTVPHLFPLLEHFTVKSGKVNIFGSEVEIVQVSDLVQGLTIDGGKLLLRGTDISTYPDMVDRLQTANDKLNRANAELTRQLQETEALLTAAKNQPTGSGPASDNAQLGKRIQEYLSQSQAKIAAVAEISESAASIAAPTPAAKSDLRFGIVFSADKTHEQALTEYNKARTAGDAVIALFKREGSIRSVALFRSRDAATAALQAFTARWKGSYIVDFQTWCPVALGAGITTDTATETDCRF